MEGGSLHSQGERMGEARVEGGRGEGGGELRPRLLLTRANSLKEMIDRMQEIQGRIQGLGKGGIWVTDTKMWGICKHSIFFPV